MSRDCEQEMCPNWSGDGCACALLDLPRQPIERGDEHPSWCLCQRVCGGDQ